MKIEYASPKDGRQGRQLGAEDSMSIFLLSQCMYETKKRGMTQRETSQVAKKLWQGQLFWYGNKKMPSDQFFS